MSKISDYLETRKKTSEENGIDQRKNNWLSNLNYLFNKIDLWLSDAVKSGLVFDYHQGEIQITEERIGSYMVPECSFSTSQTSIRLIPKGTFIIGADGRVDMNATTGRQASLIVLDGTWKYVNKRSGVHANLDEDTFLEILKYLLER